MYKNKHRIVILINFYPSPFLSSSAAFSSPLFHLDNQEKKPAKKKKDKKNSRKKTVDLQQTTIFSFLLEITNQLKLTIKSKKKNGTRQIKKKKKKKCYRKKSTKK